MTASGKNGSYTFDRFTLDTGKMMLYRDGEEILIPVKAVKTLTVLVRHPGSILSKEELISEIWEDSIVEESNLSQYLYLLRKTLGNLPDGRPYIETLRRRGYRFNGEAQAVEALADRPLARRDSEPAANVERLGNVLRLVQPAPADSTQELPEARQETVRVRPRINIPLLIVVVAVVSIATVAAFMWYRSQPAAVPAEALNELTIQRLTDGLRPADATISPDGRYIVYHETEDESARMFLQQVGQPGRVEIAASSYKVFSGKTFSPDGKFIYFVAADKESGSSSLYRIPTVGGPQNKVIDNVVGAVSFSPDGKEMTFLRLDKSSQRSELLVANADGTNERDLMARENGDRLLGYPAWSPDGSVIAYSEAQLHGSGFSGTVSLYTIDPFTRVAKPVSEEKWDTVYRIAWVHDGSGFALVGTRANDGRTTRRDQIYYVSYPKGISRRLTTEGNRHQPFSLGIGQDDSIVAVPFSRSSQIWSLPLSQPDSAVQISRGQADGRAGLGPLADGSVGYVARSGEDLTIWHMNADGTNAKEILDDPTAEELRADPQGRFFVFSATRAQHAQLFRMGTDGNDVRQLTLGESDSGDSAISPDGNWIIFTSTAYEGVQGRTSLWKIPAEGGEPIPFFDEECSSPNFSPDGSLVSCVRNDTDVLVLSASTGAVRERLQVPPNSPSNFGAVFTPDGSALAYITHERDASNIWAHPRDGKAPARLTRFTSGVIQRFAFSPDGTRLFLARGFPTNDVIQIRNYR